MRLEIETSRFYKAWVDQVSDDYRPKLKRGIVDIRQAIPPIYGIRKR